VLDLLQRDVGEIAVIPDLVVALGQLRGRYRNDLLVAAGLVFHQQYADGAHAHHGARHDRTGIGDQHVAGVAVAGQRVRDEPVIAGIAHRRIEEAVDHQRAGFLVHLVFDRLAANRHFDDDVDLARRIDPDSDGVNAHAWLSGSGRLRIVNIHSSYAGLTRVSIKLHESFFETMDCRVKPGNDEVRT